MEKYRWLFCHRIKEIGNSLIFPEIGSKKNYVTEGDKENKGRNKKKNWPKKKKIVKMKGTIRSNKKYWGIISQVR